MTVSRLVYVVNARLPTEKAHGFQVVKMCEAFARCGVDVLLLHPRRRQADARLRAVSVFDYYGVPQGFEIRALPNADVVALERFVSPHLFAGVFFAHALVAGLLAALAARRARADLYYARDPVTAFWLLRVGLPVVFEAHALPRRGQRWVLRRVARSGRLRLAVAITSFIAEGLRALGVPPDLVRVHPDAVDPAAFEGLPGQRTCRERLGLPLDRRIIGYVGRFRVMEAEKGIPELIGAMAGLEALDGAEPLLLCVGGPMDPVPAYLALARERGVPPGRLRFVDRVPNREVPLWMRACDAVTIPWPWTEFSAYFTSPLKLFEYMAAGVPIVASDLPSLRDVLEHGRNAWLVAPGDSGALAEGLRTVTVDHALAERLVSGARETMRHHTWQARAQAILRVATSGAA